MNNQITVSGVVSRYRSWDSGFTLVTIAQVSKSTYAFRSTGDSISCKGRSLSGLRIGDSVTVTGAIETHPEYGDQLSVTSPATITVPTTAKAVHAWIMSIPGVGKKTANILCKISQKERGKLFQIVDRDPKIVFELLLASGISNRRAAGIVDLILNRRSEDVDALWLRSMALTSPQIKKVMDKYKDPKSDIQKYPYSLISIPGISFLTADKIALSTGAVPTANERVDAGIEFTLLNAEDKGHTCLTREKIMKGVEKLLSVPLTLIAIRLAKFTEYNDCYYRRESSEWEIELAERISKFVKITPEYLVNSRYISRESYTHEQCLAIDMALYGASSISILTGGPGTGKTHTIKAIIDAAREEERTIAVMAPTGRAASRLTEISGFAATTIHRGFAWSQGRLRRELNVNILVIDEVSMVGGSLAAEMFSLITLGTRILLVGDANQLKSVSPGKFLHDLLKIPEIPSVKLTENFRQRDGSCIPDEASAIITGKIPAMNALGSDFRLIIRNDRDDAFKTTKAVLIRLAEKYGKNIDLQVLVPTKSRGSLNAITLGKLTREIFNGNASTIRGSVYCRGDRLICHENNYDYGVYNGDIFYVHRGVYGGPNGSLTHLQVKIGNEIIEIAHEDLGMFSQGYAITIHKSQGSEYNIAVVVIHDQHMFMLSSDRSLLYTACTRGRDLVVLISSNRALRAAVRGKGGQRYSNLSQRIQERISR